MKALLLALLLVVNCEAQKVDLIRSDTPFTPGATITLKPDPLCVELRKTQESLRSLEAKVSPIARESVGKRAAQVEQKLQECTSRGLNKLESGSLNGVAYEFHYSDGSGLFAGTKGNTLQPMERIGGNWLSGCAKDAITDEKTCYIDRGDFRVWVDSRGRSEVYIGASHYPGSYVVVRIDQGSPIAMKAAIFNGSFGYRASPAIIKRIAAANTVTTRYQKWPYTDFEDETWDTYGFKEALAYIRWAVARIK